MWFRSSGVQIAVRRVAVCASRLRRRVGFLARRAEFGGHPLLEPVDAVVVEDADVVEDFDGAFDAESVAANHREQLGVADGVTGGVPGQDDDEGPVDVAGDAFGPSSGFADFRSSVAGPGEERVRQVRVPATIEAEEVFRDVRSVVAGNPTRR